MTTTDCYSFNYNYNDSSCELFMYGASGAGGGGSFTLQTDDNYYEYYELNPAWNSTPR
jgi:hypothetical protein